MEYQLDTCVWEITLACCFSCRYCGSEAGRARDGELTTEECIDVAEQLAQIGCRRAALIGGEVFMRRDWPVIVKALTDRGVRVPIITNGFLFTEAMIDEIRRVKVESIAISIDGPQDVHDAFRQKGSFNRAMFALDTLSRAGIPVSVITTLHSRNIYRLEDLYAALKNKDIFAWQLQACSPMGNAASGDFASGFDFREAIRFVEKHLQTSEFLIGLADNIGYFTDSEGFLRGDRSGMSAFRGCQAGITSIGIDSVGNVRGCESMYDERFNEGNLRFRKLRDIWCDPDAFAYNRRFTKSALTGGCEGCKYGYLCAGGCRSYNYFTHGKLYEAPQCAQRNP